MDLPVMTMDRHEARKAFLEYKAEVKASLDREVDTYDERKREAMEQRRHVDEAVMRGYLQLSLGRRIIDLERAITEGGEDAQFRPRLAVARADATQVGLRRWRDGSVSFETGSGGREAAVGSRMQRRFHFPAGTLPTTITTTAWASAIVPTIPPHFRPVGLDQYHILWEAEWRPHVAPKDPALLRALGGGLYAVLAVWDLTEIEQAVLGILRRN